MKQQISVVITDIDNTLYDWVQMWYSAFTAMLKELVAESGLPQDTLEAEIQTIFQKHGTSEYAFVIEELPSLKAKHPNVDLVAIYGNAIKAYNFARTRNLRLYPQVLQTLQTLKDTGCLIVGFTESMAFYTMRRLKVLGLDGVIDYLYSPPDHSIPAEINIEQSRWYPEVDYRFDKTVHRLLPENQKKPAPKILLEIIEDEGINTSADRAVYVGDSLMKDIAMAQDAHVTDVYAKYGIAQNTDAYELLRRVTHWTKEDVDREKQIHASRTVTPTYVLEHSISELLNLFEFVSHAER